jgi:nucleotide-binding universal stress UspA family protein
MTTATSASDGTGTSTYTRIVVPLDLSDSAERALPHAATLARALGVPIHLLHVVDITPLAQATLLALGVDDLTVATALSLVEAETATATEYLKKIGERLADQGLTPAFEVRRGLVETDLLAATRPGDLVVMATHGGTGLARWFLGGVADAVVRNATVPVLLVRSVSAPETATDTSEDAAVRQRDAERTPVASPA